MVRIINSRKETEIIPPGVKFWAAATDNICVFHKTIMYYRDFSESNKNTGMVRRSALLSVSELRIVTGF